MLTADNWCVKVEDKIYGPYTSEQLRKFVHEGRIIASSLISPAGSRAWREAQKEASFSNYFDRTGVPEQIKRSKRAFGRAETDSSDTPDEKKRAGQSTSLSIANFLIIFDVTSGAASRVGAAITGLGHAFQVADNVWSLTCELTAVGVRNVVAPYLNPRESLFVVDATRGRTSWQNYAPETQAKITASYTAARAQSTRRAS